MSHIKDLQLVYKFTDRGGNDVYDIKQELAHAADAEDPRSMTVGELRITTERVICDVRWACATF